MPTDTTWDDVWAEYDARTGNTPAPREHKPWYLAEARPATSAAPRPAGRRDWPRLSLVGAAAMVILTFLLGLPMGDAGAPASAGQGVMAQRQVVLAMASGASDASESPALPPPPMQLAETTLAAPVLLELPPPAWVKPSPAPAQLAAAPPPTQTQRATPPRRQQVDRAHRQRQQMASARAAPRMG